MEKFSNWRYDLREVEGVPEVISNSKPTTDLRSKREVTEKPVKNKVTINPSLGDKMESVISSMGGKLISISEEGKCDDCSCKGCGKNPCVECGEDHHKLDEATYPGHDEKGNPLKPKDNRLRVSNADKKANTPAWQKYKSGDKKYTKFDNVKEDKAFDNVVASVRKQYGKGGVITKDNPPKKPTEAQKSEWAKERAEREASRPKKSLSDVVRSYRRSGESD